VINGVGWPDDRHGLSPILCDTAPLFVYTDQLLCHCILICSNVCKWLVYCMRWLLWCFCLLAESYETINHYHYQWYRSLGPLASQCTRKNAGILVEIWNRFFLILWWKVVLTWCSTAQKRHKLVMEMCHKSYSSPEPQWRSNLQKLALFFSTHL